MPRVCRIGDVHACGAVAQTGSPNVFVNGIAVHRISDIDVHCGPTIQIEGSGTVFANNLGFARIGDNHAGCPCDPPHPPSPHVTGSPNVFANGGL